uniref:Uncharacterized protein n=1 Tax=Aegilops tauschii subsp. strangulata TaxID=200361 RepID=A0A453BTR7_AEGTS
PDSLTHRHPLPPAPATLVSATPDSSSLRFRDPLGRRFEEGTPSRRRGRRAPDDDVRGHAKWNAMCG